MRQQAGPVVPLFERAAVGLVEVDRMGILRRANPFFVRLLGYDHPDDVVGRSAISMTELADRPQARLDAAALWAGDATSYQRDRTHLRRDGSPVRVQVTVELATVAEGQLRLVAVVVDAGARIAALARVEAAQREAEERRGFAATLLETIDVGILACDTSGRVTALNRTLRDLHGITEAASVTADGMAEAFRLYEVDGVTRLPHDRVPLIRALRGGVVVDTEVVIVPLDRPARLVRCDGRALRGLDGRLLGAVVAVSDITGVRRAQTDLADSKALLERANAALATREAFFRQVLDTVDVAIVACDTRERPTFLNRTARDLRAIPSVTGSVIPGLYSPDGAAPMRPEQLPLQRALVEGSVDSMEVVVRRDAAPDRRLLVHGRALCDGDGRPIGAVAAAHDITALRAGEQALLRSEELFRSAFEHGPLGMCRLDERGVLIELNPALQRLLARAAPVLLGRPLVSLLHPDDRLAVTAALVLPGGRPLEVRVAQPDGTELWCELALSQLQDTGGAPYLFAQLADVTARKQHTRSLEDAARRDPLTGLGNRRLLLERLNSLLAGSSEVAVLFVDLDEFKAVNDEHGHDAGDAVLVEVSRRLLAAVRPDDLVVRLGGDEFVLVCPADDGEAAVVAASLEVRLVELLGPTIGYGDLRLDVGASIGTTVALPGGSAVAAVAQADAAMYRAKAAGCRPLAALAAALPVRRQLRGLVDSAVSGDRLRVVYQPLYDLRTGTVVGAEALLRLADPAGGVVAPDVFIPVAEASGAIHEMGRWVLRTAAAQAAVWKRSLPREDEFSIAVNVSPRQLDDPGFADLVCREVTEAGLAPGALVLELTERLLTEDSPRVRRTLDELRAWGSRMAIDDFGTGYASLGYLARLPVDVIKLDRSFTSALGRTDLPGRVASGIARLLTELGLVAIAEGIETEPQREQARAHGFDLGQGYLMSRPLPAAAFAALLARPRRPAAVVPARPGRRRHHVPDWR